MKAYLKGLGMSGIYEIDRLTMELNLVVPKDLIRGFVEVESAEEILKEPSLTARFVYKESIPCYELKDIR